MVVCVQCESIWVFKHTNFLQLTHSPTIAMKRARSLSLSLAQNGSFFQHAFWIHAKSIWIRFRCCTNARATTFLNIYAIIFVVHNVHISKYMHMYLPHYNTLTWFSLVAIRIYSLCMPSYACCCWVLLLLRFFFIIPPLVSMILFVIDFFIVPLTPSWHQNILKHIKIFKLR